jgi:5,10-methylenetetrahydromethanopterin reductase
VWTADGGRPGQRWSADEARRIEDEGWDGFALDDAHTFAPDPYVLLGAAAATSRVKLGTWVTNPVTRHAAITAASIGVIQSGAFRVTDQEP